MSWRQHRALGAAGGAGRVEDGGEIVGLARHVGEIRRRLARLRRSASPCPLASSVSTAATPRFAAISASPSRFAGSQTTSRLGVADEIVELGQRIGGVERQEDRAGPQHGEIEQQIFRRLLDLHRDAVAGLDAAQHQHIGEAAPVRSSMSP